MKTGTFLTITLLTTSLCACDSGVTSNDGNPSGGGASGESQSGGGRAALGQAGQGGAGAIGVPVDGELCAEQSQDEASEYLRFHNWMVELSANDGSGASAGAGGVGGTNTRTSFCASEGEYVETQSCSGWAAWTVVDGNPELEFDDGSRLVWTGAEGLPVPPSPMADEVWVQYSQEYYSYCPFCGGRTTRSIDVRERPDDEYPYLYGANHTVDLADAVAAVFDTTATTTPGCYHVGSFDCYSTVVWQRAEHDVANQPITDPRAEVELPGGRYAVSWTTSNLVASEHDPLCTDGRLPESFSAFSAVRLAE